MDLKDIAAISGKSGLYKVVKPTRTGVILETLDSSKKKMIANANSRVSILKEISMYTTTADGSVMLEEVFATIKEKYGSELPVTSKSSADEFNDFLGSVLPDFDAERVYTSDIKKLASWYNIVFEFAPEVLEAAKEDVEETTAEAEVEEKE